MTTNPRLPRRWWINSEARVIAIAIVFLCPLSSKGDADTNWSRKLKMGERCRRQQSPLSASLLSRLRISRGGEGSDERASGSFPSPRAEDEELINYNQQGVINYSKFEKIAAEESSDIDDDERDLREKEKKKKELKDREPSANSVQKLMEIHKEEQDVKREDEEAEKRLCVQTPNKWNGAETDLYSFRQHIINMEVYINMNATGVPGPWKAKELTVHMTENTIDIAYRRGGRSYHILGGEFCKGIVVEDSYWVLETEPEGILNLVLKKQDQGLWQQFLKGHIGIDLKYIHGASDYFELQREIHDRYNLSTPEQQEAFYKIVPEKIQE